MQEIHIFPLDFANFEVQQVPQIAHFSVKLEAQKGFGSRFRMHATFKIMLPTAAGSTFSKKRPKIKRRGCNERQKDKENSR